MLKGEPQLVFPPTNPWLAAIGGTQSGVLILQLGEETLVNLPIACHWPWPGLFVSGTPLITPSTPSSVFPPSLPTQFLYPKTVSSFLKDQPLVLLGCVFNCILFQTSPVVLTVVLHHCSRITSFYFPNQTHHQPVIHSSNPFLVCADSSQANVKYRRNAACESYTFLLYNVFGASHLQCLVRLLYHELSSISQAILLLIFLILAALQSISLVNHKL